MAPAAVAGALGDIKMAKLEDIDIQPELFQHRFQRTEANTGKYYDEKNVQDLMPDIEAKGS